MDDLKPKVNIGAAIARGALSQVPVLGPIVNEIVGQVIPDRRLERLTQFFARLEQRVAALEPATIRDRFCEPVYVDLLEDAMFQAARAASPERIAHIAEIVARGLSGGDAAKIDRKYLLGLLSELNDSEVLWLAHYGRHKGRTEFYERHREVLEVPTLYFGEHDETKWTVATIRESYDVHLERVGLLKRVYRGPHLQPGEMPQFERDGSLKGSHTYLQAGALGYLLLREIGIPSDLDDIATAAAANSSPEE